MKCSDEHCDKMSPEHAPLLDSRGPEVLCPETQKAPRLASYFSNFLVTSITCTRSGTWESVSSFPKKCLLSLPARGRCRALTARPGQAPEGRSQASEVVRETARSLIAMPAPSKAGSVSALLLIDSFMFSKMLHT